MNRVRRILATALITAGLVVLLDVGVTLAWKEPVSALRTWMAQRQAGNELEGLEEAFAAGHRGGLSEADRLSRERAAGLATRFSDQVREGHAIGRLQIPDLDLDFVVIEGTQTADLQKGPGHYPETVLPGERGTVAIAGHRTTYLAPFRHIDQIGRGERAVLEMPYGRFTYRFERRRIVDPSQVGVVRDVDHDRLVLTACHPVYSAAQRIVVFLRLVSIAAP